MTAGFDCHVHVLDPVRHPFPPGAPRIPDEGSLATVEELDATLAAAGLSGALVVQPSSYLDDNAALLDALARGGGRHRGIAGLSLAADDEAFDRLAAAGVVGVRLNLVNFALDAALAARLPRLLDRLVAHDFWLELQCRAPDFVRLAPVLADSKVAVLFDHCGYPDVALGTGEPGFRAILAFAERPSAAMKLSGAFRTSATTFPHVDLDPFVADVLSAFGPERCVFGSDYPFLWCARRPSYADTLAMLERWLPDASNRRTVLCDAPRRLFGFPDDGATATR